MENKEEKVYCKFCKYRKNKYCVILDRFVPRKGLCDKFMPKGGK